MGCPLIMRGHPKLDTGEGYATTHTTNPQSGQQTNYQSHQAGTAQTITAYQAVEQVRGEAMVKLNRPEGTCKHCGNRILKIDNLWVHARSRQALCPGGTGKAASPK